MITFSKHLKHIFYKNYHFPQIAATTHLKIRKDSLQNIGVILINWLIWYGMIFRRKLFRCCPKTSLNFQKEIAGNTFEDRSFSDKFSLDVSQSPYIEYLQLISFSTW